MEGASDHVTRAVRLLSSVDEQIKEDRLPLPQIKIDLCPTVQTHTHTLSIHSVVPDHGV